MPDLSDTPDVPEEEWKFSEVPGDQRGMCLIWESLRNRAAPAQTSLTTWFLGMTAYCSRREEFKIFCRRDKYRPLKLLAWLFEQNTWPISPWTKLDIKLRESIQRTEIIPPLIGEESLLPYLEDRYKKQSLSDFDLAQFPFSHEQSSTSKVSGALRIARTGYLFFDLLTECDAVVKQNFVINWHQHSKDDLTAAFSKWIDSNRPESLEKLEVGGRVDVKAWLGWLSAYRLKQASKDDPQKLRSWKRAFLEDRQLKSDVSILKLAKDYEVRIYPWVILEDTQSE